MPETEDFGELSDEDLVKKFVAAALECGKRGAELTQEALAELKRLDDKEDSPEAGEFIAQLMDFAEEPN